MNDLQLARFIKKTEREWNWRQRELTFFKQALAKADNYQKNVMSRSGVILLYAHWEGFIKNISQSFLESFANTNIDRSPRYIIVTHIARMNENISKKFNKISRASHFLDCISDGAKVCASIHEIINTESNLDYKILERIALSVGMKFDEFETKQQFINRSFVYVRNAIAHGEDRKITEEEFLGLEKDVVSLMDIFKKSIIDSAIFANEFLNKGESHTCLKIRN